MHNLDHLLLEWTKAKGKYTKQKHVLYFLFDGNSNVCNICNNLQDIHKTVN